MIAHLIIWDEGNEPSKVDLDNAMNSIPNECLFQGVKTFKGKARAMLFSPPPEPVDLDAPFKCVLTPPIIHDLRRRS